MRRSRINTFVALCTACALATSLTGCTESKDDDTSSINTPPVTNSSSEPEDNAKNTTSAATDDSIASLDPMQLNSMAMLNYLAVLTEEINASKNNRLELESIYKSLYNNTNPNAVDDRTLAELESMLDTLEQYRMVNVKRERLDYLYEQNRAAAIRSALPNPLGLLSAVQSGDLIKLATSVAYMAVDSYTSYQSASDEASLQYLTDGWELDDEESAILHQRQKDMFAYTVRTVQDYDLPGEQALSQENVQRLVKMQNNDNVVRRIQFLESNKGTYQNYGGYWVTLAESYYEQGRYQDCLDAVTSYENLGSEIFRKDEGYARIIPLAIASASETMNDDVYITYTEEHVKKLLDNCSKDDWELNYFAAQTYVDLYSKTNNQDHLERAYSIALDNVNGLIDTQYDLNDAYLSEVKEAQETDDMTKEQKKEIKQYNKMLNEVRKTELPPVYQPLLINCELLFALADELEVSDSERGKIDGILHPGGEAIFLTEALNEKYCFNKADNDPGEKSTLAIKDNGTQLVLPAELVNQLTTIEVKTNSSDKKVPGKWTVTKVKRDDEEGFDTFKVVYENEEAEGSYRDGDIVTVTLTDADASMVRSYEFKATIEEHKAPLPDKVTFELIS